MTIGWKQAGLAFVFLAAACGSKKPTPVGESSAAVKTNAGGGGLDQTYSRAAGNGQQMCGGIAALACPEGQKCLTHDTYPDASGICVGPPEAQAFHDRCGGIRCLAVQCPDGFRRHLTPGHCCGTCIPDPQAATPPQEGTCQKPDDCNDLPHILCLGSWSCDQGSCRYTCGEAQ